MVAELRSYGDLDLPTFLHESGIELLRHPAPRQRVLDPAAPGRRPSDARWVTPVEDRRCSSGSGRSPTSTTGPCRPRTADLLRPSPPLRRPQPGRAATGTNALLLTLAGRRRLATRTTTGSAASGTRRATVTSSTQRRRPVLRRRPALTPSALGSLADVPLRVHARYQREEVLAALGYASMQRKPNSFREGVCTSRSQRRRLLRHAQEVGGRLLADDDVSRLPDQPRAVPLGVAVDDIRRLADRPALRQRQRAPSCCSSGSEQKDEFGTAPYLFLGPARTSVPRGRAAHRDDVAAGAADADRLLHVSISRCRLSRLDAAAGVVCVERGGKRRTHSCSTCRSSCLLPDSHGALSLTMPRRRRLMPRFRVPGSLQLRRRPDVSGDTAPRSDHCVGPVAAESRHHEG